MYKMEYQKIINLIGDDVESKFQTKDYVVINDRQAGNYTGTQIKIITNMLRSSLCDFSRAYIKVTGRVIHLLEFQMPSVGTILPLKIVLLLQIVDFQLTIRWLMKLTFWMLLCPCIIC